MTPLDPSVIAELSGIDEALLGRVLTLFAERAPAVLDKVASLSQSRERAALADAVHGLKSICASIGARQAFAACHELEKAARSETTFDFESMTAHLARELQAALREAEALRRA